MSISIGVLASERIAVALVEQHKVSGAIHTFPATEAADLAGGLHSLPCDSIAPQIVDLIKAACGDRGIRVEQITAVGVGFPGIIGDGVVLESPNLQQVKGLKLRDAMRTALRLNIPVLILNDADAMAAGIAAIHGQLEKVIRVWTLGNGIGFGRYPHGDGVWEGGHSVVTLDSKEQYCGCGGQGHLEGIMGHRAMRMRFLDMEPEEVFAAARAGDARCISFYKLWHRALAAATATSIHLDGPGRFFISGPNARFIEIGLMGQYLHEMVKMSPLQGSVLEVVSTSTETAIVGAAVNAELAAVTH